MKTLLLSTLLTLTFSANSFAWQIEDPNDIMSEVEWFKEGRSFKQEFKKGDFVTSQSNTCYEDNGSRICDVNVSKIEIVKVSSEVAYFSEHTGFSKATYDQIDRNPLRLLTDLNEFQSFAQSEKINATSTVMQLDSFYEYFDVELGANAMKVLFTLKSIGDDYEIEIPMYVVLVDSLPFFGQISEFNIQTQQYPSEGPLFRITDWLKIL